MIISKSSRANVLQYETDWEEAFFGPDNLSAETLERTEHARLDVRNTYNAQRRSFATLGLSDSIEPIGWDITSPQQADEIYGSLKTDTARAFAAPDPMPAVEQSRKIRVNGGINYWLRFPSPSNRMNDTVVARVYEPVDAINPPTIVFGHGICVEFDHWRGMIDEVAAFVDLGIRVIRPEAPWHGRRVLPGSYGGERFIATAPLGALDLFTAAAREWSVLIDWARHNSNAAGRNRRVEPWRHDGANHRSQCLSLAGKTSAGRPLPDHPLRTN